MPPAAPPAAAAALCGRSSKQNQQLQQQSLPRSPPRASHTRGTAPPGCTAAAPPAPPRWPATPAAPSGGSPAAQTARGGSQAPGSSPLGRSLTRWGSRTRRGVPPPLPARHPPGGTAPCRPRCAAPPAAAPRSRPRRRRDQRRRGRAHGAAAHAQEGRSPCRRKQAGKCEQLQTARHSLRPAGLGAPLSTPQHPPIITPSAPTYTHPPLARPPTHLICSSRGSMKWRAMASGSTCSCTRRAAAARWRSSCGQGQDRRAVKGR